MKKILLFGSIVTLLLTGIIAAVLLTNNAGSENKPENVSEIARRPTLERFYLQDAEERDALCNDGSDPVYHYRPAEEGFEDKWIVWFEGGGSCNSEEECVDRWNDQHNLMTTKKSSPRQKSGGILSMNSETNPDFYQWNHVRLNYCSSDAWKGDIVREIDGNTIYFKGKNIVQAVLEDLGNESLFGEYAITLADKVLVTGTSAGASGVSQNINDIAGFLEGVDVRGVTDSAWGHIGESPIYSAEELADYKIATADFLNSQFDDYCLSEHVNDPTYCATTEHLLPYWQVPVFVYIDQFDRNTLINVYGITDPEDPDSIEIMERHALEVLKSIQNISAIFSPRAMTHGAINVDRFTSLKIDGYSFQEILGNWYFNRDGPTAVIATEE